MNRKKTIILISAVALIFIALAIFFLNSKYHFLADTNSSLELYGVSPNVKLVKGMPLTDNKSGYAVTTAKNEYEPFVVAVKNNSDQDQSLRISAPAIAGYKFEFSHVKFVDFGYNGLYHRQEATELYADPLVPIVDGGEISIPHNGEEFVWVNVFAEKNVVSGAKAVSLDFGHGGIFSLRINQTAQALPDKSTFSNIFDFSTSFAYHAHGYNLSGPSTRNLFIEKYVNDFSEHRISPTLYYGSTISNLFPSEEVYWDFDNVAADPHVQVDFSRLKPERYRDAKFKNFNIAPYALSKDLTTGVITLKMTAKPTSGVVTTIECGDVSNCSAYDLAVTQYFSQWNDYLINNGLMDNAIYYLVDEAGSREAEFPKIGHLASLIKQAAPRLKIAFTYYIQDTSAIAKMVAQFGSVDIWIPHISSAQAVDPKSYVPAGKDFWVYDTSTVYRADNAPEESRLMPWMAYKYGASGNLYWASNSYYFDAPWSPKGSSRYGSTYFYYPPSLDPNWAAIDGMDAWHNAPVINPGLVKSIRLEMIREGVEDIELIKMLETKNPQNAAAQELLARIKSVYNPLTNGGVYGPKFDELIAAGKLTYSGWIYALCDSYSGKWCLYSNRETTEPDPPHGLTESGSVTITLDNVKPGKYKLMMWMNKYTSAVTGAKAIGSTFSLKVNNGPSKTYDYYGNIQDPTLPNWVKRAWAKTSVNSLTEIQDPITVSSDGVLTIQFDSVEEARAAIFAVQIRNIVDEYGTSELMASVKNMLNTPVPLVDAFNIAEGQTVTTNPYMLSVKVKDVSKVEKVEYYIDSTLICTSTLPDVNGVFDCAWDTSKYHSIVKIIVYGTDGQTEEMTRNTTVDLSGGQESTNPIVTVLPKTGESNTTARFVDFFKFVLSKIKTAI